MAFREYNRQLVAKAEQAWQHVHVRCLLLDHRPALASGTRYTWSYAGSRVNNVSGKPLFDPPVAEDPEVVRSTTGRVGHHSCRPAFKQTHLHTRPSP